MPYDSFNAEIDAGMQELEAHAGLTFTYAGKTIAGTLGSLQAPPDQGRLDVRQGPQPMDLALSVRRSALAAANLSALPRIGEAVTVNSRRYLIAGIMDVDPTDPEIRYVLAGNL